LAPTNDLMDLTEPSREADEDLVRGMHHVSFIDASSKLVFFLNFYPHSWQALTMLEGLAARRSVETV
jgi:hypothetical protein